ncbi:hypothetical protein A464_4067 [Salmonella bongori N268-08]|uniref:Uncharacterized protein n=1 Tax=Salmonella bongori N268-08 TaxID=1197719 RepID=S5MX70_SALBN|nr:hypothetical protein A464_4067 [Salmonella bongori N268-08]
MTTILYRMAAPAPYQVNKNDDAARDDAGPIVFLLIDL